MIRIDNIKLKAGHAEADLKKKIDKLLDIGRSKRGKDSIRYSFGILRQSIDARRKPEIFYVYSVAVETDSRIEDKLLSSKNKLNVSKYIHKQYELPKVYGEKEIIGRPVIVGSGPAGLFCAYILCQCGYKPIVLERGECMDERIKSVDQFWKSGILKQDSNVQFGEGGAGTFSDGKLNTGVNDKHGRNQYVLDTFVKFGAREETAYTAKPHIGTDILVKVVKSMREYIKDNGGTFMFDTRFTGFVSDTGELKEVYAAYTGTGSGRTDLISEGLFDTGILYTSSDNKAKAEYDIRIRTNCLVLAIGHSARDTFEMLKDKGIEMKQKEFAVGLRIQHPQSVINRSQYGCEHCDDLPAADYKLTDHTSNDRSVYSFCMCPGGYVVNASSEEGRLAVNGMSYSGRNSINANSALIVGVDSKDFGSEDVLAGMEFQRRLEERAYRLGNGKVPIQRFGDFRDGIASNEKGKVIPQIKGAYDYADLRELLPDDLNEAIIESIEHFGGIIKDYDMEDALLAGVESRTSSPVRIVRNDELMSSITGIYPCGEGAGYAGGITSAAMDGIKVAEKIIGKYSPVIDKNSVQ